jgi:hypothetical protein
VKTILNIVNGEPSADVGYPWARVTRYTLSDAGDEVIKKELALFHVNLKEGTIDLEWREFTADDRFFDITSPSTFLLRQIR